MKKKVFIIMAIVILPMLFGACDSGKSKLNKTQWEEVKDEEKTTLMFSELEATLRFESTTSSFNPISHGYSYTYEKPKVTMYPKESGVAKLEGTISGKTMILINTSTEKAIATLTRK